MSGTASNHQGAASSSQLKASPDPTAGGPMLQERGHSYSHALPPLPRVKVMPEAMHPPSLLAQLVEQDRTALQALREHHMATSLCTHEPPAYICGHAYGTPVTQQHVPTPPNLPSWFSEAEPNDGGSPSHSPKQAWAPPAGTASSEGASHRVLPIGLTSKSASPHHIPHQSAPLFDVSWRTAADVSMSAAGFGACRNAALEELAHDWMHGVDVTALQPLVVRSAEGLVTPMHLARRPSSRSTTPPTLLLPSAADDKAGGAMHSLWRNCVSSSRRIDGGGAAGYIMASREESDAQPLCLGAGRLPPNEDEWDAETLSDCYIATGAVCVEPPAGLNISGAKNSTGVGNLLEGCSFLGGSIGGLAYSLSLPQPTGLNSFGGPSDDIGVSKAVGGGQSLGALFGMGAEASVGSLRF